MKAFVVEKNHNDEIISGVKDVLKPICGENEGSQRNTEMWNEIFDYIAAAYDEDVLKRIYINGDGAEWIKSGAKLHAKAKFVLDRFHMHKYILAATSHLLDSAQDVRSEMFRAINGRRKKDAEEIFDRIIEITNVKIMKSLRYLIYKQQLKLSILQVS